jgi:hypothetical protein
MRRSQTLVTLCAVAAPSTFAGCLSEIAPAGSGSTTHRDATPTATTNLTATASASTGTCDEPSTLRLLEPEYELGPSNETPPVSTAALPTAERDVALAALDGERYATCGDATALRSLADRIETRHERRVERHS